MEKGINNIILAKDGDKMQEYVNGLIYTQLRYDDNGNPNFLFIPNEQKKIINNMIVLDELPYYEDRVIIANDNMVEIDLLQPITNTNQYKVNYNTATVYFYPDRDGQTMTMKYTGKGLILIDGSRVVTLYENGTIKETLDSLISTLQINGDYAKEQGDYAKAQGDSALAKGTYAQTEGDYAKAQGDFAKQMMDDFLIAYDNNIAITHNMNTHPFVLVYGIGLGYGDAGYGDFGYGGGTDWQIPCKTEFIDLNHIKVYLGKQFSGIPTITSIGTNLYNIVYPSGYQLQARLM